MPDIYLQQLKKLILDHFSLFNVKIYLFGSYARGDAKQSSDVDIAFFPIDPLPNSLIVELRNKLEESNIPYSVDVVDMSQVDETFKKQILTEAIVWKD